MRRCRSQSSHSVSMRCVLLTRISACVVSVLLLGACGPSDSAPDIDNRAGATRPRVLSLVPSINELLLAMGAVSHIVGRTDFDADPRLVDLPSVGGGINPSLERIAELRPDMMFVFAGRDAPDQLENLGITVYGTSPQSLNDIRALMDSLGVWLGLTQASDSLRLRMDSEFATIAKAVEGRARPSVIYMVWHDPPMVAGSGTFVDEIITIAGGINVFGDASQHWPTVGMEAIVERQPDVVLWPRGETTRLDLEDIRQLPGWRDVRAVREGRVAFVDANLFNRPGPNVIDAAGVLVRILHPNIFLPNE